MSNVKNNALIEVPTLIGMREELGDIYNRESNQLKKVANSLAQHGIDRKTEKGMKSIAMKAVKSPSAPKPTHQQAAMASKLEAAGKKFREQNNIGAAQAKGMVGMA